LNEQKIFDASIGFARLRRVADFPFKPLGYVAGLIISFNDQKIFDASIGFARLRRVADFPLKLLGYVAGFFYAKMPYLGKKSLK